MAPAPILIVDDNRDAADMLGQMLEVYGYVVRTVYSSRDALDVIGTFKPAVALLDIGLPQIDGYELARAVRDAVPSVRLIAVTAYGQPSDRERAFEAGFHAHLVKPVSIVQLRQAIEDQIATNA